MNGFLPGTRASLTFDLVLIATFLAAFVLGWSLRQAKKGRIARHRRTQIILTTVLGAALLGFELEVRIAGWRHRALRSPFYDTWLFPTLYVHLCFAVATALLWGVVFVRALRANKRGDLPGRHSRWHRRWAQFAAAGYLMTVITGTVFYALAFVA